MSMVESDSRSPAAALISNAAESVNEPTVVPWAVTGRPTSTTSVTLPEALNRSTIGASFPSWAIAASSSLASPPTWNMRIDFWWVAATGGENGCPWVRLTSVTR
jgi:hypothetical protein